MKLEQKYIDTTMHIRHYIRTAAPKLVLIKTKVDHQQKNQNFNLNLFSEVQSDAKGKPQSVYA